MKDWEIAFAAGALFLALAMIVVGLNQLFRAKSLVLKIEGCGLVSKCA